MNLEQTLLLDICKSYLTGETVIADEKTDWRAFYHMAKNHNLIGVCHCVFAGKCQGVPESVRNNFKEAFFDLIYIHQCQSYALEDVKGCLKAAEIPFIVFKGAVIRGLYPVPESRAMGDIDILIKEHHREAAKDALKKAGFSCDAANGTVREFSRSGIRLEVHTRLFTDLGDSAFTDAFENAYAPGASPFELRMNDDYHFAYLIAHIAHHFKFYGAGLRMILDLAVILNTTEIDINRVLDILSKINLDTFAREILSVCFRWFSLGRDFGRDVTKTEEYLLKCGAFGSLTENTGAIVARKDLEDGKSISSPFLTKVRLAFPSYNRMKNIPYIRFIEGRPWLTPYAWCYRFFYNFKNRGSFVVHTVKSIDDKDTQALAAAELKYFEEIGLWHF